MRVNQSFVHPVLGSRWKPLQTQFARRKHDFNRFAVESVSIDVDIRKIVIRTDHLSLPQRIPQGAPVPQPDILYGGAMALHIKCRIRYAWFERYFLNLVKSKRLARVLDVGANVWRLSD